MKAQTSRDTFEFSTLKYYTCETVKHNVQFLVLQMASKLIMLNM